MLVKQFTRDDIEPLQSSSTVEEALSRMEEFEVDHYPVVNEESGNLQGMVSRSELESHADLQSAVQQLYSQKKISVEESKHIFEAIRLVLKHEVRQLAVIDAEKVYKGLIRKQEIMEALSGLLNLQELGSILTIEMEQYDYTLTKLIELIETEGAKILGLAVETPTGQDNRFRVSIKLNTQKTGNVTATLRRFGYHITTDTENDYSEIDYQSRASELLHYIDM